MEGEARVSHDVLEHVFGSNGLYKLNTFVLNTRVSKENEFEEEGDERWYKDLVHGALVGVPTGAARFVCNNEQEDD